MLYLFYTLYSIVALLFLSAAVMMIWIISMVQHFFLTLREPASAYNFKKPDGETVEFYSSDGVFLTGIFVPAKVKAKGTVIFCPEVDADARSCVKYSLFLTELGYNLLSIDFRGHGNSSNLDGYISRQWVSSYEVYDLLGAIEYVSGRPDVDPDKIALFGVSRGGGAAICAAAQSPDVRVVITDSAFSSKKTLNAFMKKWTGMFLPVDNLGNWIYVFLENITIKIAEIKLGYKLPAVENALKTMKRPVLMIHGQRDAYISIDQARWLFALAGDPKELLEVPAARHNESVVVKRDMYRSKIVDFLHKHM
ncbi:MAG TPA: alpha/beta fold hydrolase [bacterium]|nr:alpha/beta fold hydrolase [bacterium]